MSYVRCRKCQNQPADRTIGGVPVCKACWSKYGLPALLAAALPNRPEVERWEDYRESAPPTPTSIVNMPRG